MKRETSKNGSSLERRYLTLKVCKAVGAKLVLMFRLGLKWTGAAIAVGNDTPGCCHVECKLSTADRSIRYEII